MLIAYNQLLQVKVHSSFLVTCGTVKKFVPFFPLNATVKDDVFAKIFVTLLSTEFGHTSIEQICSHFNRMNLAIIQSNEFGHTSIERICSHWCFVVLDFSSSRHELLSLELLLALQVF